MSTINQTKSRSRSIKMKSSTTFQLTPPTSPDHTTITTTTTTTPSHSLSNLSQSGIHHQLSSSSSSNQNQNQNESQKHHQKKNQEESEIEETESEEIESETETEEGEEEEEEEEEETETETLISSESDQVEESTSNSINQPILTPEQQQQAILDLQNQSTLSSSTLSFTSRSIHPSNSISISNSNPNPNLTTSSTSSQVPISDLQQSSSSPKTVNNQSINLSSSSNPNLNQIIHSDQKLSQSSSQTQTQSPSTPSLIPQSIDQPNTPTTTTLNTPSIHQQTSPSYHQKQSPSYHQKQSPSYHQKQSPSYHQKQSPSDHHHQSPSNHNHQSPSNHNHHHQKDPFQSSPNHHPRTTEPAFETQVAYPIFEPTPISSSTPTPVSTIAPISSTSNQTTNTQSNSSQQKADPKKTTNMTNRSRRQLGEYSLGKTLGAGSMGKVKLAISSVTGEKIAIKIIPRHTSLTAAQQQVEKSKELKEDGVNGSNYLEKAKIKDQGKEVRTIREASIVLLLHHPYVCGMKSMLVYPHHYYMLFEYVNGGQMLDYIISHGRLRERAARKFARQMGSALEYCHANSIVHRDLKIENILISKTGNIKIIDFGLSNLFSPNSNLQTFCGSLYFAAPELLNAKVYIGPEVDVWSFGIVLFVLVCGKVPFDDQSMPALHAKIKRGHVDYPTWLSSECKHILSRMLVTNPQNRASLSEVLSHPWMVKGFDGPPDSHIPHREPLRINEIQEEVVKGMTGFEFGTAEKIEADLRAVLTSELYQKVLKNHDSKRSRLDGNPDIYSSSQSGSSASMAANGIKKEHRGDRELPKATSKSAKRFSGFGFYGKKIAAVLGSNSTSKNEEKSNDSNPLDTSVLLNGQSLDTVDPTRGFHPLISIYYLVREKIEREKIYGPGFFASSTLSVTGPPPPPAPPSAYKSAYSPSVPDFPDIRAPAAAAVNTTNDNNAQTRSALKHRTSGYQTSEEDRSRRTKLSARPSTAVAVMSSAPKSAPASPARAGDESDHHRRSTQANAQRSELGSKSSNNRAERVVSMIETSDQANHQSTSIAKRFGSFLGRSSSVAEPNNDYKRHRPRTSIGGSGHKSSTKTPLSALPQVTESKKIDSDDVPLSAPANGKPVSRASTIAVSGNAQESTSSGASRTISHSASAGSSWRPRLNSLHNPTTNTQPEGEDQPTSASLGNGTEANNNNCTTLLESEEEETTNREIENEVENERPETSIPSSKYQVEFSGRTASPSQGDKIKPIYLKGLFSVATTSTRGPQVLRSDLIKVLNRIGVQNREIKGGFECAHAPSIDLSSLGKGNRNLNEVVSSASSPPLNNNQEGSNIVNGVGSGSGGGTGAMIKKKLSRGSFIENGGSDALSLSNQKTNLNKKTKDDLVVRFEIFVVKMPLLPGINGLQFRRISGNVWQYQTFAKRILQELKL